MPDGDIVHSELSWFYQRPYLALCEEKYSHDERVWIAMGALRNDIKSNGVEPVMLAKHMGKILAQVIKDSGENGSVNWADLSVKLDRIAQEARVSHRIKEVVLRAGKKILHDFRYGRSVDINTTSEAVVERYIQECYRSNFQERIPLTSNHHADVDDITLKERVEAILPEMLVTISKWAKRVNADENVANLRRPRRWNVREIDLDEDLL